jgi:hypothetical protein
MSVDELKILATKHTPEIDLNPDGVIEISGRSMIEDVNVFSKQLEAWINEYILNPAYITCIDFHMEYLATNNLKFYIDLLARILSVKLKDKKCIINWYFDEGDEDILEKGENISSSLTFPFNYIEISDPNIRIR